MANFTILVANNLYFYMARIFNVFFEVQAIVTKSRARLGPCRIPGWFKLAVFPNYTHTTATATGSCFKYNRITYFISYTDAFFNAVYQTFGTRDSGYPCFFHGGFS